MTSEATETLLDRDAELAALRRTLDDAREGQGRLVIVEGEAGIAT
jgi:predicted ATPase